MLGKMIIHGLMAIVLVAGAAGLYAASAGQMPTIQAGQHSDHHHDHDDHDEEDR